MKTLVRTTAIALAMGGLAFGAAAQETTDQTSASNAQAGQQMQASFCERPWATIDGNDDGFVAPNEASGAIDTHFSQIDANGNGEITKTEYVDCLSRMSGQTAAESDRDEQSFSSLDLNGDNQVNLEEFRDSAQKAFETAQSDKSDPDAVLVLRRFVWLLPDEAQDEASLKDMTADEAAGRSALTFRALDQNSDGIVDTQEWSERSPTLTRNEEWAGAKFDELDADSTGSISQEEYREARNKMIDEMSTGSTSTQSSASGQSADSNNSTDGSASGGVPVFVYRFWAM